MSKEEEFYKLIEELVGYHDVLINSEKIKISSNALNTTSTEEKRSTYTNDPRMTFLRASKSFYQYMKEPTSLKSYIINFINSLRTGSSKTSQSFEEICSLISKKKLDQINEKDLLINLWAAVEKDRVANCYEIFAIYQHYINLKDLTAKFHDLNYEFNYISEGFESLVSNSRAKLAYQKITVANHDSSLSLHGFENFIFDFDGNVRNIMSVAFEHYKESDGVKPLTLPLPVIFAYDYETMYRARYSKLEQYNVELRPVTFPSYLDASLLEVFQARKPHFGDIVANNIKDKVSEMRKAHDEKTTFSGVLAHDLLHIDVDNRLKHIKLIDEAIQYLYNKWQYPIMLLDENLQDNAVNKVKIFIIQKLLDGGGGYPNEASGIFQVCASAGRDDYITIDDLREFITDYDKNNPTSKLAIEDKFVSYAKQAINMYDTRDKEKTLDQYKNRKKF